MHASFIWTNFKKHIYFSAHIKSFILSFYSKTKSWKLFFTSNWSSKFKQKSPSIFFNIQNVWFLFGKKCICDVISVYSDGKSESADFGRHFFRSGSRSWSSASAFAKTGPTWRDVSRSVKKKVRKFNFMSVFVIGTWFIVSKKLNESVAHNVWPSI